MKKYYGHYNDPYATKGFKHFLHELTMNIEYEINLEYFLRYEREINL